MLLVPAAEGVASQQCMSDTTEARVHPRRARDRGGDPGHDARRRDAALFPDHRPAPADSPRWSELRLTFGTFSRWPSPRASCIVFTRAAELSAGQDSIVWSATTGGRDGAEVSGWYNSRPDYEGSACRASRTTRARASARIDVGFNAQGAVANRGSAIRSPSRWPAPSGATRPVQVLRTGPSGFAVTVRRPWKQTRPRRYFTR